MAINSIVQCDGYNYEVSIGYIDVTVINDSRSRFEEKKAAGVILNMSYDDDDWKITDGKETRTIGFHINEVAFSSKSKFFFGCNLSDYKCTMKILITSSFGASIATLQSMASCYRKFFNSVLSDDSDVAIFDAQANWILDLLDILPGDSDRRQGLQERYEDISEYSKSNVSVGFGRRVLAQYQSYFLFDRILNQFWNEACPNEKILYFPIYLWWQLTVIIPLRPTEFMLTPRNCLLYENGHTKLLIRRTKLKGQRFAVEYSVEKDYYTSLIPIPDSLASEIRIYIASTENSYKSDIDTLFCKHAQFSILGVDKVPAANLEHYQSDNLRRCLDYFFENIVHERYGYKLLKKGNNSLIDGEIEKISLGDTRHIAMISLIASGGSPLICMELAGHKDINISSHYYGNIKSFLDVLSFERLRCTSPDMSRRNSTLEKSCTTPIKDGYCTSPRVSIHDYTDCLSAVSFDAEFGCCNSCKFFVPRYPLYDDDADLRRGYDLLRFAIAQAQNNGGLDGLDKAIKKFQAAARLYSERKILNAQYGNGTNENQN